MFMTHDLKNIDELFLITELFEYYIFFNELYTFIGLLLIEHYFHLKYIACFTIY